MDSLFLDTNVIIAYLVEGDQFQKPAGEILEKIEHGKIEARMSTMTLLEVTYVLKKNGRTRTDIMNVTHALLSMKNTIYMPITSEIMREGTDLCSRYNMNISDAIIAATAIRLGQFSIVTEDRDFDNIPKEVLKRKSMKEV